MASLSSTAGLLLLLLTISFTLIQVSGLRCFKCLQQSQDSCLKAQSLDPSECHGVDDWCDTKSQFATEDKTTKLVERECVSLLELGNLGIGKPQDGCQPGGGGIDEKHCLCQTDDCNKEDQSPDSKSPNVNGTPTGNQGGMIMILLILGAMILV